MVLDLVDEGRLLPVSHTVYGGPYRTELSRLHDLSAGVMQHSLARATPLFQRAGAVQCAAAAGAGHPAPVRISDAGATELELPGGPPLGVAPGGAYPLTAGSLGLGETLLVYTDGLVEDRGEDYDESVQRMLGGLELWSRRSREPATSGAGRSDSALERLADLLTLNVTERHSRPDDVALLLLHRISPSG